MYSLRAPLGVAVIGCGSTAHRRHLPVWQALAGARLVAVASRDPERRQTAMRRYGAARAVADWRLLLADPEVEAVDICAPHPLHAEIACAAARAGRHVLCEKPLATALADAEAMADAAASAGVVLLPFHNMRAGGVACRAVEIVSAGRIGRPRVLRGVMAHGGPDASDPNRRWFLRAEAGGGAILDLGPHLFDLIAHLAMAPATRLRATLRTAEGQQVERDGLLDVEFADGALAQLHVSWSHVAGRETGIVVQGETGVLRLQFLWTPEPSAGAPAAPLSLATLDGRDLRAEYPPPADGTEPCAQFLRAVRGESVALTAEDGLETVRYIEAAYASQRAGGAWTPLRRHAAAGGGAR